MGVIANAEQSARLTVAAAEFWRVINELDPGPPTDERQAYILCTGLQALMIGAGKEAREHGLSPGYVTNIGFAMAVGGLAAQVPESRRALEAIFVRALKFMDQAKEDFAPKGSA